LIEERFDDEGYSGATLDRPALQRLLNLVREGGIEQVVIHRLDRLSRNLRHFTALFEELGEHNVALEIVTAPGLGNAATDKLMLNILGSFAEFERDLAASGIAEARAHLKAHGRRSAGATPFGYSADPHTKQLVVCDEEASAVVRMFQWAAQGIAPSVIASYANALGWITGGGKPWTPRQVLSILSNHVYAGLVEYGIGFRQGCHVPLIDRDVYHKVQNWIAARRTAIRCGGRKAHGNAPSGRPAGVNGPGARQPSRAVRGIENGLSGQVPQLFVYARLRQAKRSTATRHLRTFQCHRVGLGRGSRRCASRFECSPQ